MTLINVEIVKARASAIFHFYFIEVVRQIMDLIWLPIFQDGGRPPSWFFKSWKFYLSVYLGGGVLGILHPFGAIGLNFGMLGHIADVMTHAKFCDNLFRGFRVLIPIILLFSIGIAGRPYNSVSITEVHCESALHKCAMLMRNSNHRQQLHRSGIKRRCFYWLTVYNVRACIDVRPHVLLGVITE